MTKFPHSDHLGGKTIVEHLKEARTRGALAAAEVHGTEMPGHLAAAADAAKETALALVIFWCILSQIPLLSITQILLILVLFSLGWLIWKMGRSALLGWARLERLHRITEEERWEIEHHRDQEKEELTELYRAKGLSGRLLEEVIDIFMADDNRVLRIMLEEELGLTLEAYEHPLKQCIGAGLGVLFSSAFMMGCFFLAPTHGLPIAAGLVIIAASAMAAKLERNHVTAAIVWNLATAVLASVVAYFLTEAVFNVR